MIPNPSDAERDAQHVTLALTAQRPALTDYVSRCRREEICWRDIMNRVLTMLRDELPSAHLRQ